VAYLLAFAGVAEVSPRLQRLQVFHAPVRTEETASAAPAPPSTAIGEATLEQATEARLDLAQPEQLSPRALAHGPIAEQEPTDVDPAGASDPAPVPIVDGRRSLSPFFQALARTERREAAAVTRVLFLGDSVVASDFGTGTLRRLLDARFGDAGHGFVLIANGWPQYFHNDIERFADKGFRASRIVGPRAADGLYGLGGVSFVGAPGMRSRFGTTKQGEFGRNASRFELSYVEQPGGGDIEVSVDGVLAKTIETNGSEKRARFADVRVPDGPHEFEVVMRRANVRLFGAVLERDEPGVVLDAVGVVGARIRTLDESDDAHFAEALGWRRPNLVVYQFGANESGDGFAYPMPEYHRTMADFIDKVKRATPNAGCLIIGAMDRARKENDRLVTVPIIPHIVEEQRKVAEEIGCAYWSAFDAMGGRGSMAKWVRKGFGAGDYTHPTSWGADQLGKWIYSALMASYAESKAPQPQSKN
jgi:lysophospholipase L1-like esterase